MDKFGNTIDYYPSSTRNTKAAERFLGKAQRGMKNWEPDTLKAPAYAGGKCPKDARHWQVKYLNNAVEPDTASPRL